jgi:SAM-dependent methyltransferase
LRFIKDRVPSERTFIGNFPECVPKNIRFDAIVLGGIEYLLDDTEFTAMVSHARDFLKPGGTLILLSWSFYEPTVGNTLKYYVKEALVKVGFYNKKLQFWGYSRTPVELKRLIESNGFIEESVLIDGRLSRWETFAGLFSRDEKTVQV